MNSDRWGGAECRGAGSRCQFRCAGSKEYVDWIDRMLGFTEKDPEPEAIPSPKVVAFPVDHIAEAMVKANAGPGQNRFSPFQVEFFDQPSELEHALRQRGDKGQTARFLASYARSWKTEKAALPHDLPPHLMDFHEPYQEAGAHRHWSKVWNYVPKGSDYTHFIQAPKGSKMFTDPLCEVGCPYAVRGFDFDYVGLLWLSDLVWRNGAWKVDPIHVFERGISRKISAAKNERGLSGRATAALLRSVQEAYRIILTRPIKGLFIWCEDPETRTYLETAFRTDPRERMMDEG